MASSRYNSPYEQRRRATNEYIKWNVAPSVLDFQQRYFDTRPVEDPNNMQGHVFFDGSGALVSQLHSPRDASKRGTFSYTRYYTQTAYDTFFYYTTSALLTTARDDLGLAKVYTVRSSFISSLIYQKHGSTLYILFRGGSMYTYPGVTEATFHDLLRQLSKGRYFNKNIRGRYAGGAKHA
jgi:hypothetical protein